MDLSSMYVATSSVTFGLTTVLFLLTFRRDRVRRGTREEETTELLGEDNTSKKYGRCPEDEASVMSSISYMWIFGLLRRGYKQPLEPTDLYALSYRDSSEALYPVFENKWGRRSQNTSWPGVQLFLAMLPVFWVDLLHAVLHRLSWMVWGFMKVIVLSALIQSIEQQKDYKWEGVLLSVLLTLTLIACGVSFKFSKFSRVRAGMRMNVVLMGGIFRKCLRLSSRSLSRTSVGEVINLVSVDMKKIKDMMDGLTEVVSLVFEVPLTLLLLYLYLDRAVLVPVLLMLSVILCNMAVLKKYAGLQVLSKGTFILSSMLMAAYTSPLFLTVVPAIVLLLYFISKYAIRALRQLLRINSILVSPINSHMDESLAGATSIRAFNAQDRFIDRMESLVDHSQAAFYLSSVASRWLSVVLQCVASLSVLTAALLAVNNDVTKVTAGLASMSVTFMVDASTLVKSVIDSICNTEVKFVAAERILNYCALSLEAPCELPDSDPPESWPNSGDVEFSNYSTRYRPGLDLVLKDVSFKIKSGEKIGVVGRTGAGKSSVALSLFRIIEAASGQIIIDGRDVADMGLHCLRSKLTIIPQEPVLFNGTLRHNLDPSETKNDHESWEALEKAHLKSFVSELVGQLEFEFEGDDSVSVGQRQLVCLARALLRKSKILVLDEATASIDVQTDDIIQTTIRTAFKDCTVITIAHRINTILDYDRILVMSGGRVVEFDSPDRLLKDPSSTFYKLASQAGVINGGEKL